MRAKAKAVRLAEPQPGQAGPSVAFAVERGREGRKAERAWRPRRGRRAVVRCGARHLPDIQRSELGALVGDGVDRGVGQVLAVPGRVRRRQERVVAVRGKTKAARLAEPQPGQWCDAERVTYFTFSVVRSRHLSAMAVIAASVRFVQPLKSMHVKC